MATEKLTAVIDSDTAGLLRGLQKMQLEIAKAGGKVEGIGNRIDRGMGGAAKALRNLSVAFVGVAAARKAASAVNKALQPAIHMEQMTAQLVAFEGSTEAAQQKMEDLSQFAATTPFQLPGVMQAFKTFKALNGVATDDHLRLIGDAAALSGEDLGRLAVHVGRAFSGLRANRPIGEAMNRLMELGLITGDTRTEIEKLQKAGQGEDAIQLLTEELSKAKGTMEAMSNTAAGLQSTLKDNLFLAISDFGKESLPILKDGLRAAIQAVQELRDSGNLAKWGAETAAAVRDVGKSLAALSFDVEGMEVFSFTLQTIRNTLITISKTLQMTIQGYKKLLDMVPFIGASGAGVKQLDADRINYQAQLTHHNVRGVNMWNTIDTNDILRKIADLVDTHLPVLSEGR